MPTTAKPFAVRPTPPHVARRRMTWAFSIVGVAVAAATALALHPAQGPASVPVGRPTEPVRQVAEPWVQPAGPPPVTEPPRAFGAEPRLQKLMPLFLRGVPPALGVMSAAFQQPDKPPVALPPPTPMPSALPPQPAVPRLSRLGTPAQLGGTPVPSAEELDEYKQFVDRVVDPRNTLDLIEGRARLIVLKAVPTRTQIADDGVAVLRQLEPQGTQLTVIGRRTGTTVLNLWFTDPAAKDKEKVLSYLVRVLPDPEVKERQEANYKGLEAELNTAFPRSRVRLSLVGDKLMVSGQAHDIFEAAQILRILRANAPGADQEAGVVQAGAGRPGRIPLSAAGPTGNLADPTRPDLTPGLEEYQTAGGPSVINTLRIPGEQQVMLRVTVAEVNRAAARSIGLDFSLFNSTGTRVAANLTGQLAGQVAGAAAGAANLPISLDNGRVAVAINALRTLSYARSLAEPTLTAMNGQTATFLAGGQFPVPVLGGFGQTNGGSGLQGVQFVPYGVQLGFSPIITDRDRVRLTVNATVSTRDLAAGATVAGANVPGLNSRTFSTTVELREGQTLAVAGLIQTNIGATASRVPLIGDLPIIGRAAGFQQATAGEQELVVLITPELVHPLDPGEHTPLPGCDLFEPGDVEFYLLGRLESRRTQDYRSPVMTDVHRMLKYRRCEQQYIVGP